MAFRYSAVFRDDVCRRMLADERVECLVVELDVSPGTLYRWKRQALIDVGRRPGVKSFEPTWRRRPDSSRSTGLCSVHAPVPGCVRVCQLPCDC